MDTEKDVPFKVYESAQARADHKFKMMWMLIVLLLVILVGSNTAWIIYESQYEDTVITQDLDADEGGTATINDGVHINDESETNN